MPTSWEGTFQDVRGSVWTFNGCEFAPDAGLFAGEPFTIDDEWLWGGPSFYELEMSGTIGRDALPMNGGAALGSATWAPNINFPLWMNGGPGSCTAPSSSGSCVYTNGFDLNEIVPQQWPGYRGDWHYTKLVCYGPGVPCQVVTAQECAGTFTRVR
jgi:hypothetical protein